jgi:hypothetical protein
MCLFSGVNDFNSQSFNMSSREENLLASENNEEQCIDGRITWLEPSSTKISYT